MVGVPGRSKACRTCKRRKKGCDGQEPTCGQCARAGILCEGYDKDRIFVNTSQKQHRPSARRFVPKAYAPKSPTKPKFCPPRHKTPSPDASPELAWSLARAAEQSQYFDNFWNFLLPNGKTFSSQAALYSTARWTCIVQEQCEQDDLVRAALLANALGVLGDASDQPSIKLQGLRAYGRALNMLARAIASKIDEKGEEIIAASTLLTLYELIQGSKIGLSFDRWRGHVMGQEAITLARGPEFYVKGRAHQLFIDNRLHMIYPYFKSRTRSPFSSPEWKSVPWTIISKDPKNEFLDIIIDIPGLLEDFDKLLVCSHEQIETKKSLRQTVKKSCWLLDYHLQRWAATSGLFPILFVESHIFNEEQDFHMPSSEDFAMAHLGVLYWTTCLILYQILGYLNRLEQKRLPARMEPRQYCRKIMLLMPYFQQPNINAFFLNMTAFSTIAVARFLDRHDAPDEPSEERKLLMTAFKGRFRRLMANNMEDFKGSCPWRDERLRYQCGLSDSPAA